MTDRRRPCGQNRGSKAESTHEDTEAKLLSPLEDLSLVGEVVPIIVEVEVAVPRLTPAIW